MFPIKTSCSQFDTKVSIQMSLLNPIASNRGMRLPQVILCISVS